jgi:hypothetical protein
MFYRTTHPAIVIGITQMSNNNPLAAKMATTPDYSLDSPDFFDFDCSPESQFNDWPEPRPLPKRVLPIAGELPTELLPEPMRTSVNDMAYRLGVRPETIAVAMLVTLGSLIGANCRVRPKLRDDWTIVPNLWGAVVDYPGGKKTPAINAGADSILKPLRASARRAFQDKQREYEVELMEFDVQQNGLKKKLADPKNKKCIDDIKKELRGLQKPEPPKEKRYCTNEVTAEKFQEMLSENPRGLLMLADELTRILQKWDSRGHESDRSFFLEGWTGGSQYDSDTLGRGNNHCSSLTISLLGGIQPGKLKHYLVTAEGDNNDGLVQRLQVAVFPEKKPFEYIDQKPDPDAAERLFRLIEKIDQLDYEQHGAELDVASGCRYLRFSEDASGVFQEWITELEQKIENENETKPLIAEHLAKYRSLMPSLTLIFAIVRNVNADYSQIRILADDARLGAAWCEFLEVHARKIYALIDDAKTEAVALLAEKIQQEKLKERFTRRVINRANWSGLKGGKLIDDACKELTALGWLRREDRTPGPEGGAPTVEFFINPRVLQEGRQ